MPIIGLNFKSIEGKVESLNQTGDIKIDSSPKITNIEKRETKFSKDVIFIDFNFETKYTPKVGSIKITGEVIYQGDDIKKFLDRWKNDKKIEGDFAVEILNMIFRRCFVKALDLSNELRLPTPIQLPKVVPQEQQKK